MTSHLEEINQNYFEHMKHALFYSTESTKASFYFLIHAFLPWVFVNDGSQTVSKLQDSINRSKNVE